MPNKELNLILRVQALALIQSGVKMEDVVKITGFSRRTIHALKAKAMKRWYDPAVSLQLKGTYTKRGVKTCTKR